MTTENPAFELRPDARIDSCPKRPLSVGWPEPMHGVLREVIKSIAEVGGGRTSQQEVIAALVQEASQRDPDEIVEALRNYRKTQVQDL